MGTVACTLVLPPFKMLRQENHKFEISLDNIGLCLSQTNKQASKANRKEVGGRKSGQREGYMLRFLTIEVSLKQNFKIYPPPRSASIHPKWTEHLLCARSDRKCQSTMTNTQKYLLWKLQSPLEQWARGYSVVQCLNSRQHYYSGPDKSLVRNCPVHSRLSASLPSTHQSKWYQL